MSAFDLLRAHDTIRRRVLEKLVKAYPSGVSMAEMLTDIGCSEKSLFSRITELRRQIEPDGWMIPSTRGIGASHRYRLVKIEEKAAA
jgi:hypothetical protein